MIAAFRPVRIRADGHINAVWMKFFRGEDVIDVVALICVVMEIKGFVCLFPMITFALMVIKAVKSALAKQ
jgi:hypothetical protein